MRLGLWEIEDININHPVLIAQNWDKEFRCHFDASQKAVGGTFTQVGDNRADRVIDYF